MQNSQVAVGDGVDGGDGEEGVDALVAEAAGGWGDDGDAVGDEPCAVGGEEVGVGDGEEGWPAGGVSSAEGVEGADEPVGAGEVLFFCPGWVSSSSRVASSISRRLACSWAQRATAMRMTS